MPSQQSSFIGMRTALIFHVFIARIDAESIGPSERPKPWMQAYSVPIRFTPCSTTVWPAPFTRLLPCTWSGEAAPVGALGAGVALGTRVGVGTGLFVDDAATTEKDAAGSFQL